MKKLIRCYLEWIIECSTQEEAYDKVFYGSNGIDQAFQHDMISWEDHQLLLKLIGKMPRESER